MSEGLEMTSGVETFLDGEKGIYLYEDRFYETLLDLAEENIRAYARPIMASNPIAGEVNGEKRNWDTEFRVYIQDGEVVGVSNYYPQVEMTPKAHAAPMLEAVDMARHMIGFMKKHDILCDNPKYQAEGQIRCTLDFFQTKDGEMLLLEGGPEGLFGAHPCCFLGENHRPKVQRDNPSEILHGATFSTEDAIITLDELVEMVPETDWSKFADRELSAELEPGL
jgi:hypothetical protein